MVSDDDKETKNEDSDKRGKTQTMLYYFIKIIIYIYNKIHVYYKYCYL